MYQLLPDDITGQPSNVIRRTTDNVFIAMDEANRDYQEYLEWLAEGNTPEAADG